MGYRENRWLSLAFISLLLIFGAAGCSEGPAYEAALPTISPLISVLPSPDIGVSLLESPLTTPVPATGVPDVVVQAIADLAERLNIGTDAVTFKSQTSQEMPLTDLGCGEPGKKPGNMQPAVVIGDEIVLQVGDKLYVYHAYLRRVLYCGAQNP